ncbi:MAG: ATP-binding protein [bacterium]
MTALLGPRQCGKTTISRIVAETRETVFFDLEDPVNYQQLVHAPMLTLQAYPGLIILDEIQRMPGLLPVLRVLADRKVSSAKFLILGSASPQLMKQASETLAGRIAFVDMSGFNLNEVGPEHIQKLWLRGGFPRSYLSRSEETSFQWRQDFIRTFLERDIPQLGISIPAEAMRRFWTMLAHFHGQIWNGSEFARSIGATEPTARRYLDILSGAFVVRQLQPWYENISKRQVKSPKVYVRDSGLLHSLLSLDHNEILRHQKLGASWEGFMIEQLIAVLGTPCYFWATHAGAELDLFTTLKGRRFGFEIKYADAPRLTKSMTTALDNLSLERLLVIYPGEKPYALHEKVQVIGAKSLLPEIQKMLGGEYLVTGGW